MDCPKCDAVDYGFELPDTRATYYIPCDCGEDDCEECCELEVVEVRIERIWDKECPYCHGVDWRPQWQVVKDGKVIATTPSENAAHAVIKAEWPNAEPYRDEAWESERFLRQVGG